MHRPEDPRTREPTAPRRGASLLLALAFACLVACSGDDAAATTADDAGTSGQQSGEGSCASDAECDDGLFCTGEESCVAGLCEDGAPPRCDDGIDCTVDVCDESAASCVSRPSDDDGDGHPTAACTNRDGLPLGDDCDDTDPQRFPGNPEQCDGDDHDEDCDAETFGERDADGDGYFDAQCCNGADDGTRYCGDDCDDAQPTVHPNESEACDGMDNDCNGEVDDQLIYCRGMGIRLIAGGISAAGATEDDSQQPILRIYQQRFDFGARSCDDQGSVCITGGISP